MIKDLVELKVYYNILIIYYISIAMSEDSEGKFDDWKESGEDIVEVIKLCIY